MFRVPVYIADLIRSGEGQTLDFKFEISNSKKIARTLVAFANTGGGKLLIGVKDNGVIAGVKTQEEVFMIDSAASLFSKPEIEYAVKSWNINGKQILEVVIPEGRKKPYFSVDARGIWRAYLRLGDRNLLANDVIIRFLREKDSRRVWLKYTRPVKLLVEYLSDFDSISMRDFCNLGQISAKNAKNILVDLLILGFIDWQFIDDVFLYSLGTFIKRINICKSEI